MKIFPYNSSRSQFIKRQDNTYQKANYISNIQQDKLLLHSYSPILNCDTVQFGSSIKTNPLDMYLGGYKKEKEVVNDLLVIPLNKRGVLPPSMLLAFPDDSMKEQLINGIKKTADANFVTLSAKKDFLAEEIKVKLQEAKKDFQNTKKQTVIIVNESQNAIGMTPAYAKELSLIPMSDNDIKYLKAHGTNIKKVNFFKSLLDMPYQNYATIIFTTTKPQYIHPDLITRDGKMKKVIFPIPKGRNLQEVIKFETTQVNNMLESLKSGSADYLESIEKRLTKLKDNGRLKKMRIDEENIPYHKLMRYCTPSKIKGAYSLSNYNNIAINALKDYVKQPQTPYSVHFIFNLVAEPRAVKPENYLQYDSMKRLF